MYLHANYRSLDHKNTPKDTWGLAISCLFCLLLILILPSSVHAEDQASTLSLIDGGKPMPVMLKTQGNQLVTPQGQTVWLQGVNIPSLEWTHKGQHIISSIAISIEQWHANIIRLPVHTKFWFGTSGLQHDGGKAYRELVDQAIQAIASRGAYVVLDLHEYKAIHPRHIKFWLDAAKRYANHPAVMFGLLNEPSRISWDTWRNGGEVQEKSKPKDGVIDENNINYQTFQSPGMQACLDTVRSTGAKNICVIGALDWAYDLSGILNGYAIDDPNGNGILYDTHVYPWKTDWQGKFLDAAAKYPVLLGEVGCDNKRKPFIPENRHEDPYTWNPDILGCIQKYKLHWTGWSFHPKIMAMLQDWNYEPTPYWGVFAKDALNGKPFTMKKMR
jgi:aryl-phospho-beta-D-glucosidase BglC (GH1 family)